MDRNCEFLGCLRVVEFSCECKQNLFFCHKHLVSHLKKPGKHITDFLFVELEQNQIDEILQNIADDKKNLAKAKELLLKIGFKALQRLEETIKKELEKIALKVKVLEKTRKLILSDRKINKEDYQEINNTRTQAIDENSLKFDGINRELEKLASELLCTRYKGNFSDDKNLFWVNGNSLSIVDLDSLKQSTSTIQFSSAYASYCRISENEYLLNDRDANAYILTIENLNIVKITNCSIKNEWGTAIYLDFFVYFFGGDTKLHHKYDLINKQLSSIATLPLVREGIGSAINGHICLTGCSDANIYAYEPKSDTYKAVFQVATGINKLMGKNYLITSGGLIYKQLDDNISNWTSYNATSIDFCWCLNSSYLFFNKKYIYWVDCGNAVYRVDTELYSISTIQIT
jgi:hypothetical protein